MLLAKAYQDPVTLHIMSTSDLQKYFRLATYATQKIPGVALATTKYLAFGPKPGQEDSDIRTVIAVAVLSSFMTDARLASVEQVQGLANTITPVPAHIWGISVKFDVQNGRAIEDAVNTAISQTRPDDIKEEELPKSTYAPCLAEWQAPRKSKGSIKDSTDLEKYNLLQEDCSDKEAVLLYFHGGAHYLGNETGHRDMVSKIAGTFGGKAFSVRYRLAPQEPFPAALTDALAAYDYLVNPPKTAVHRPVNPRKIVLAGDSAGGNLASALMATLIESQPKWELPAGLVLLSPWADLTHSLPSISSAENDYLPTMLGDIESHKSSKAWKADGTQRQFYCSNAMVTHPLVSTIAYDGWRAIKSVLIQCGAEERLRDEGRYLAQHMAEEGVLVQYDEYQSMPHVFQMVSPQAGSSKISIRIVGEYMKAVTTGESIASRRVLRNSKDQQRQFDADQFKEHVREKVKAAMIESREHFGKPYKSVL